MWASPSDVLQNLLGFPWHQTLLSPVEASWRINFFLKLVVTPLISVPFEISRSPLSSGPPGPPFLSVPPPCRFPPFRKDRLLLFVDWFFPDRIQGPPCFFLPSVKCFFLYAWVVSPPFIIRKADRYLPIGQPTLTFSRVHGIYSVPPNPPPPPIFSSRPPFLPLSADLSAQLYIVLPHTLMELPSPPSMPPPPNRNPFTAPLVPATRMPPTNPQYLSPFSPPPLSPSPLLGVSPVLSAAPLS